jgi:hypothetical protein
MVANRSLNGILTACLLLASCRSFDSTSPTPVLVAEATPIPETSTPSPDYVTLLRNAKYQLGAVDALRIVQLTDGTFENGVSGSNEYVSVNMTDFTARGDLNGDGVDEYAAMVAENYGGSGVFVFLVVYAEVNGQMVYETSVLVDDRPQLNELSIKTGRIFLDATTHKTDDPMCCPSLHSARHYQLIQGQLDMTDYVTFTPDGRPRTITISAPANGAEVFSSVQIKGSVAIAPFENNLAYRVVDGVGVELAIGSITVSATEPGATGTFDQSILLGNILSGAMIRIEVRDVNAADGSIFAMDSVELVVK